MRRVETTQQAEDDLAEAALFIAKDNLAAAEKLVDEVASRYTLIVSSRPR